MLLLSNIMVHVFFAFQRDVNDSSTKTGMLFLVDLAGSEMVKKTLATGKVRTYVRPCERMCTTRRQASSWTVYCMSSIHLSTYLSIWSYYIYLPMMGTTLQNRSTDVTHATCRYRRQLRGWDQPRRLPFDVSVCCGFQDVLRGQSTGFTWEYTGEKICCFSKWLKNPQNVCWYEYWKSIVETRWLATINEFFSSDLFVLVLSLCRCLLR